MRPALYWFVILVLLPSLGFADETLVGNPDFVHLKRDGDVWWFVDHKGNRFITTGMNHVGEGGVLFNEVNDGWMTGRFGADIQGSWGGLNPRAKGIGAFADMVVKDFKDYAFNTIPFHAYSVPLELFEERQIYYVAKIKSQSISLMQMNRKNGQRFPDVFSQQFYDRLDQLASEVCAPLRDAKYCLGYTYYDMPDLKPLRRWQRWMFEDKGLIYPWVQDMRALPAHAAGKQQWIKILKQNHASAPEAANAYAIDGVSSWDELAALTQWPVEPRDRPSVQIDADDMLVALAEKWYGLHHQLIKKYDPNHLLLGDKHDVGFDKWIDMIPERVLEVIGKYNDVLTIQYYSFYNDQHNEILKKLHRHSNLPIINGDHSYAYMTDKHTKIKGLKVDTMQDVAKEYRRYMRGTMQDHPYMLGWWHCGYIEQWAPAGTKQLGQQCGFFDPFGRPNMEVLPLVKQVNESAARWHEAAQLHKKTDAESPVAEGATLEELVTGFETVEGPLFDGQGNLFFTDIPNQHIWKLDVNTLKNTLFREHTGGANGLAFDAERRLLMCKQRDKCLARLESDGSETILLEPTRVSQGKPAIRVGVNDVVVDRKGRIYVTVPGAGTVHGFDPDGGNPRVVVSGLKGPNGLMLSPDESRLYVSEYKEQRILAFERDLETGLLSNKRLLAQVVTPSDFGCDGMTVDDRGNVYCAGPNAVRIWSEAGQLLETISMPESPTNCTFSGRGSDVLYITGRKSVYRIQMKAKGVR